MPTEKELIEERKKKREQIMKLGINPYPYRYEPTHHAGDILKKYADIKAETKTSVRVAGRIIGLRRMGKITFMHVLDRTGQVQAFFTLDNLKEGQYNYELLKLLDRGDWIGVEGPVFKTKAGEITIKVTSYELLCKSLRPLPEKWHGLKDIETRYRKRYVDLVMNPEVREVLLNRTKIMDTIRGVLNKQDFIEVETPILQPIYGGARARPFKTKLHALDMDVYLRISNELYLKKLIVGGLERVYEFSKDFRNEDIDRTHNPEFTQIEIYKAYADFSDMKKLTEDIFVAVAKALHGSTKFEYQGQKIDVKKPWKTYRMADALRDLGGIDVNALKDAELKKLCAKHKIEPGKTTSRGMMEEALFDKLVEPQLVQPTFIIHHPLETTPLCKTCREPSLKGVCIERFEPFIVGMEVANGYSELNDPIIQRKLLEEQAKQLKAGEEEAHPMDEDFVEAIEYGMPPTGGVGIGIDRMAMILTNSPSIRDVIFFPFMKI